MTAALVVAQLEKRYAGVAALKGVSFTVNEGKFLALLGPNGAGKSTTIGIICGLVNKTGGSVSVFGSDIDSDFPGAKKNVGIVPQEFNFSQFEKEVSTTSSLPRPVITASRPALPARVQRNTSSVSVCGKSVMRSHACSPAA